MPCLELLLLSSVANTQFFCLFFSIKLSSVPDNKFHFLLQHDFIYLYPSSALCTSVELYHDIAFQHLCTYPACLRDLQDLTQMALHWAATNFSSTSMQWSQCCTGYYLLVWRWPHRHVAAILVVLCPFLSSPSSLPYYNCCDPLTSKCFLQETEICLSKSWKQRRNCRHFCKIAKAPLTFYTWLTFP